MRNFAGYRGRRRHPRPVQPESRSPADGAIQIKSSSGAVGFVGPGGGGGGRYHHYTFELFALDTKLALAPEAIRADVMKAMDGHVIVESVLVGRVHM